MNRKFSFNVGRILAMVAVAHLIAGCNLDGVNAPNHANESINGNGNRIAICQGKQPISESPVLSLVTANGTAVDVQSAWADGNAIRVHYTYQSATGSMISRQLDLHKSLLSMTVYDKRGIALVGHEFDLMSGSAASYRVWSGKDQFIMDVAASDDSVTISLTGGTRSTSISGANETWAVERGELLADAVSDYAAFALDNEELATVEYLLADEGFLKYLYSEFGDDIVDPLHRTKLCAITSLLCTVCGFFWWCAPCWIPCVPACGIALACALADLFS